MGVVHKNEHFSIGTAGVFLRRNLITSGELKRLIGEDGLRGMTSNPSIFEKAIAGSTDYDAAMRGFTP